MRFLHIADLHLGKTIYGVPLIESGDQPHWVERFIEKAAELRPDAVVIAGDVYDRSAPSGDAVELLSRLLTGLADLNIPVLLTAGNHDSAQRLAFAAPLLAKQNVHITGTLMESTKLTHVTIQGVTFWLMPYLFPALVRDAMRLDETPGDYGAAVRTLLAEQDIDFTQRNVLVAHQNVTANGKEVERGGSETMVGGVGQVDYTAFDGFDYVALGHIHRAYPVGRPSVRYAGTPMCYHFDECRQRDKGALLVEIGEKGAEPVITPVVIPPLHPMHEIKGAYEDLRTLRFGGNGEYLRLVLTDCRIVPEIRDELYNWYEKLGNKVLELYSEYQVSSSGTSRLTNEDLREKSIETLFAEFCARDERPVDERDYELLTIAGELCRHAEDTKLMPTDADIDELLKKLLEQEDNA